MKRSSGSRYRKILGPVVREARQKGIKSPVSIEELRRAGVDTDAIFVYCSEYAQDRERPSWQAAWHRAIRYILKELEYDE